MDSRARTWIAILGVWTLLGVFFAAQARTMYPALLGQNLPWSRALGVNLIHALVWALITPLVLRLTEHFPWEAPRWPSRLLLHLGAGLLLATAQLLVSTTLRHLLIPEEPRSQGALLAYAFRVNFHTNLLTYACVAGAAEAWAGLRRARARDLHASQLEARLAQAQLQALKMQLRPHFLFNALNGVSALIASDPDTADEMLARLGTLLRFSLERGERQEIPLREELDFIAQYLELERLQYADRLAVATEVPPELLDLKVPTLILQPLVENALRHGLAPRAEGGTLTLRAHAGDRALELEVLDDGYGPTEPRREGIGLSNVRERLGHLYGSEASFELAPRPGGGAVARLRLPLEVP